MNTSEIHKYIFVRLSRIADTTGRKRRYVVGVEAYNKDHAIQRLTEHHKGTTSRDWDYLDEVGLNHFVGILGEDIPLVPRTRPIAHIIKGLF